MLNTNGKTWRHGKTEVQGGCLNGFLWNELKSLKMCIKIGSLLQRWDFWKRRVSERKALFVLFVLVSCENEDEDEQKRW